MKYFSRFPKHVFLYLLVSCGNHGDGPSKNLIDQLELKRGRVISCGPAEQQFGPVQFDVTGSTVLKKDFNLAVSLLHSFEYDEAEKTFSKIIDETPDCAMAYWGIAMCNFHPLWNPPATTELQKGAKAIEIANNIKNKSARESGYIAAIGAFYRDWEKKDHLTRCLDFEKAMEQLYRTYPSDKEAAIFYALALNASADPTDKTYAHQKKAGAILTALYPGEPDHPGIIHYLIHTYDNPELAELALPAARKYARIAPSSAHALHMPSHIFTRLGLWDECISSNLESVSSAKCYAAAAGIKGHWDEELHGLDYLVYAYLQKGENAEAQAQLKYLDSINLVYPANFKVAYAFAAIPSRYYLENKLWPQAAALPLHPTTFAWGKFPWQEAILHFARFMGALHSGKTAAADAELKKLHQLHDTLEQQKDLYKSRQVAIQIRTAEAWRLFVSGDKTKGLQLMQLAADMEDSTEKHPVTPGSVLPARELLGDMYLEMLDYKNALQAYETVLKNCPNRFNSLYGAGLAAEKSGDREKAVSYYRQLTHIADSANSGRQEWKAAKSFIKNYTGRAI
jgi:tetratricopeptide (TPR) repeat protein